MTTMIASAERAREKKRFDLSSVNMHFERQKKKVIIDVYVNREGASFASGTIRNRKIRKKTKAERISHQSVVLYGRQ